MSSNRILGVVLLVVGLVFLLLGMNATDSIGESLQEGITGNYSDRTTWYLVGGAVLAIVGGGLALFGRRAASVA